MIVRNKNVLINVPDDEAHYYELVEYPTELEFVKPQDFDFIDNVFVFNLDKYNHRLEEDALELLRLRRNEECFSVINQNYIIDGQSKTWFDTLTEEQKQEASVWVQGWRDVTETKVVPTKPSWLN